MHRHANRLLPAALILAVLAFAAVPAGANVVNFSPGGAASVTPTTSATFTLASGGSVTCDISWSWSLPTTRRTVPFLPFATIGSPTARCAGGGALVFVNSPSVGATAIVGLLPTIDGIRLLVLTTNIQISDPAIGRCLLTGAFNLEIGQGGPFEPNRVTLASTTAEFIALGGDACPARLIGQFTAGATFRSSPGTLIWR